MKALHPRKFQERTSSSGKCKIQYGIFLVLVVLQAISILRTSSTGDPTLDSSFLPPASPSRHLGTTDATAMIRRVEHAKAANEASHTPWFDPFSWNSNQVAQSSCHYIEDICHASGELFYNPTTASKQPHPFSIHTKWMMGDAHYSQTLPAAYPDSIDIRKESPHPDLQCTYSMIPNHMVMFSFANHMLGEFYVRSLMGLFDLLNAIKNQTGDATFLDQFRQQTQLYLQLDKGKAEFLESHQLFLGLFSDNPVLHFKTLLDNTSCRCMKRLFFCGYNKLDSANSNDASVQLQPGRMFGKIQHQRGKTDEEYAARMRDYVRDQLVLQNPIVHTKVQEQRQQTIRQTFSTVQNDATSQHNSLSLLNPRDFDVLNASEWKIVGLAQREGRRRWLDLDKLMQYCNHQFIGRKVICMEVNIEKEEFSSPMQHILAHAGLDALIGIHGAQLTEALLMPKGALVVELLPWIFPGINWGIWTQWAHQPTPLGVLFSGSSLNHVGYPLKRSSAKRYCQGASFHKQCFSSKHTSWDNRDFEIDESLLEDFLEKFVVTSNVACQDYKKAAGEDYVLYNVNCQEAGTGGRGEHLLQAHHFYRDNNWIVNMTHWSTVDEKGMRSDGIRSSAKRALK